MIPESPLLGEMLQDIHAILHPTRDMATLCDRNSLQDMYAMLNFLMVLFLKSKIVNMNFKN